MKEELTNCYLKARKLAIRDPRNTKEYYTRIVNTRLERIIKRRYGVDYWLSITN
jgi:hypothetical protein